VYQSIDDPQDELETSRRGRSLLPIWLLTIAGLAAVFYVVYQTSSGKPALQTDNYEARLAEATTYRKAIAEQAAPMRRARMQDFLTTYPESSRIRAIEAQLDVINLHETQRWSEVMNVIFNPEAKKDEQLAALDDFETEWGGSLLGGRGDEIRALRADITGTIEAPELPDRKLKETSTKFPNNIPDSELVGGPRPIAPPIITAPPVTPTPDREKVVELTVVQPKIRRNSTPRYPRKAMRRGVEGIVVLKLNIDAKGKVAMTELVGVEAPKYSKDFVKAAERAAMRTRFHPKTVGGKPQPATGIVKRYRFQLGDQ